MKCNVNGHPITKTKWMLNGKKLVDKTKISITSDRTLKILSSSRNDEGMYQCFVSNNWEEVQATAQIILGGIKF